MSFQQDGLRFQTHTIRKTEQQRLRVHSDGKIKTNLKVLAKGHPEYSCGKVEKIVSDAKLFNLLTEQRKKSIQDRKTIVTYVYTEKVRPIKNVERVDLLAPTVPIHVTRTIGHFLTALLAFKGKTLEIVTKELKLLKQKGGKSITFNVNTLVTWGEVRFKVGKITVKKTHDNGIFFCSKTCKQVANSLSAAMLTKDGQVNEIG